MNFNELLSEANNALKNFLGDERGEPISARTLRYWISKGVLDKRGTRGPKTSYPESFVWRVILTRQYQLFSSMTLNQIAAAQAAIADDEVMASVRSFRHERSKKSHSEMSATTRRTRMETSRSMQSGSELFSSLKKVASPSLGDGELISETAELREELQRFRRLFTGPFYQRLELHEESLRNSTESARETLALAAEHADTKRQDEIRQLSQRLEFSLSEMREQFAGMHAEWAALLTDLAGTVGDLHQKIDDLNDQISQMRKYSPIDGGEN